MSDTNNSKKPCILIVDDEPELLSSLQRSLRLRYEVFVTTKSAEVVGILQRTPIDCILLDIRMPKISGLDLLKDIKFDYSHIPVIIMSGNGDENDAIKALKLGAAAYLKKPLDIYTILEDIEKSLTKYPVGINLPAAHILLVDDDENFLTSMQIAFASYPYQLTTTSDPKEALSLIESNSFEILITDFTMPCMTGLELISKAKQVQSDLITILITGKSSQELAISSIKNGAFDYIKKPVEITEVVSSIERSMRQLSVNREIKEKNQQLLAKGELLEDLNSEIITQKNYLSKIVESISNMLIITNEKGEIKTLNEAAIKKLGYLPHELLEKPISEVYDIANILDLIDELTDKKSLVSHEGAYNKKNGGQISVLLSASMIAGKNDEVDGFVFIAQDISDRKKIEAQLYELSYYDSLTKLPNRLHFELHTKQKLAAMGHQEGILAIMYIDLDGFKAVNDRLGHHAGDQLLKAVAKRLKFQFRPNDFIARIGGDEFIACVTNITDKADLCSMSKRIIQALNEPITIGDNEVCVGASIGIVLYPESADNYTQLLKEADMALYKAKDSGRNQFQFFTKNLDNEYAQQAQLESALRLALEREEFFLVYQPIYDLETRQIISIEALLRWENSQYGLTPPNKFIQIAELNGLIAPISRWVIDTSMYQYSNWQAKLQNTFNLALNISASQLEGGEAFIAILQESCQRYHIAPNFVDLELTEVAVMQNPKKAEDTLLQLDAIGFNIVIDDFGQGFSSLSLLSTLPVSVIKIDKYFIHNISNAKNKFIIKSIVSLSKSLSIRIIAEGIEDDNQLQQLLSLDCYYGQGFYLCKPELATELPFLNENQSAVN